MGVSLDRSRCFELERLAEHFRRVVVARGYIVRLGQGSVGQDTLIVISTRDRRLTFHLGRLHFGHL